MVIYSDAEFKQTRRGKVKHVVRERYMRKDIACGLENCRECSDMVETVSGTTLSSSPHHGRYIMPDVDTVVQQIDALQHSSPDTINNLIILETVLDHVRKNFRSVYDRLVALIRSEKRVHLFPQFCLLCW